MRYTIGILVCMWIVIAVIAAFTRPPQVVAQTPEPYSVSDRIERCARLGGILEAAIMNPDPDESRKYTLMHQMAQRYDAAGC